MIHSYLGSQNPEEIARLEAQQPGVDDALRRALARCALPPRPRVLEPGCGTGVLTCHLAEALPDAQITAIDLDERLLAAARKRCPQGRIRFERQDAASLPYPTRSFDLAICRYVLMHQDTPLAVVGEMHRVVALGGYAIAFEPDWGARAVYPPNDGEARLLELAAAARRYGWPDVLIGRKLFALFRQAGFLPVHLLASATCQTADDTQAASAAGGMANNLAQLMQPSRSFFLQHNLISPEDFDDALRQMEELPRQRDYLLASMEFTAIGVKSAPPLTET
ncbi:MAG TPA: methyltransferase domain-containing protein [Ktedonobacterales bacterium]|jgi:ubiquinone/menaquinone biosynthesis C-methylase UbiE